MLFRSRDYLNHEFKAKLAAKDLVLNRVHDLIVIELETFYSFAISNTQMNLLEMCENFLSIERNRKRKFQKLPSPENDFRIHESFETINSRFFPDRKIKPSIENILNILGVMNDLPNE